MAFDVLGLRSLKGVSGLSTYFTLPSIGGLYKSTTPLYTDPFKQKVMTTIFDMFKFGIPLYPDTYEENGSNTISEQVLVGGLGTAQNDGQVGGLTKVADNIVVNPRTWRIHGYMGFDLNTTIGRDLQSGVFLNKSTGPLLQSFVNKFGRDVLNSVFKQTLQYLSEARRPFKFNTKEGETIPCLFKSYSVKSVAENNNFVEVDLELQEFRFLALTTTEDAQQVAIGGVTSVYNPHKLGRSALSALVF